MVHNIEWIIIEILVEWDFAHLSFLKVSTISSFLFYNLFVRVLTLFPQCLKGKSQSTFFHRCFIKWYLSFHEIPRQFVEAHVSELSNFILDAPCILVSYNASWTFSSAKFLYCISNWIHINENFTFQAELYSHHTMVRSILSALEKEGARLCTVYLVDSNYANDPGKRHFSKYP